MPEETVPSTSTSNTWGGRDRGGNTSGGDMNNNNNHATTSWFSSTWCEVLVGAGVAGALTWTCWVLYDSRRRRRKGKGKTHSEEEEDELLGLTADDNDDDAKISELDLEDFEEACDFVEHTSLVSADVFEEKELLELYGLYKQATEGECEKTLGLTASVKERYKRQSWKSCSGMSKSTAMTLYVGKVLAKAAQRDIEFTLPSASASASDHHKNLMNGSTSTSSGGGGGGSVSSNWGKESTSVLRDPYRDEEDFVEGEDASDRNSLWYNLVAENESERAMEMMSEANQDWMDKAEEYLKEEDHKKRSALHWATDHGNLQLVTKLLQSSCSKSCSQPSKKDTPHDTRGADPNAVDSDGQTPLHYAALCEYQEIYALLVQAGGDEEKGDMNGETPKSWTPATWR